MTEQGPKTPFAQYLHSEKYRAPGESFPEAMNRISGALTENREEFLAFREILSDMRFMPGGRVQAAVGAPKQVTPYNCFVSGTIEDTLTGPGSIMSRAKEAAVTMRMGGGIGYDFSTLRPRGAHIKTLGSQSSGPIAFMGIFDAICDCISSSGHRRGAQMGVLRIDHPDIEEFIHVKQNDNRLNGFNISIGVTDEFMHCLNNDKPFDLRFNGEVYDTIDPAALWDKVMRSTWDWAEPGILFIDKINWKNNLRAVEEIRATNPCGEQPLPPNGACLLGSFNTVKYLRENEEAGGYYFDYEMFATDIPKVVRAMDRVVDIAKYPLMAQEVEAKNKRRMGLGLTGLANCIEALGYSYGSPMFLETQEKIMKCMAYNVYEASIDLAEERGAFPLFNAEEYLAAGTFASDLPEYTQQRIRKHGIRNSHLLSIAPTGTISLCSDNVSSGIEPVFALETVRTVQTFDGPTVQTIKDYAYENLGVRGKVAAEVTAEEHLAVLALAQRWVDSSVSKTCNVPEDMPWEEFKQLYVEAFCRGCKGLTTFQTGGKRAGILVEADEGKSCRLDPVTGRSECE
jgi:ribonucleoside-diphosphate reductase alpha chain